MSTADPVPTPPPESPLPSVSSIADLGAVFSHASSVGSATKFAEVRLGIPSSVWAERVVKGYTWHQLVLMISGHRAVIVTGEGHKGLEGVTVPAELYQGCQTVQPLFATAGARICPKAKQFTELRLTAVSIPSESEIVTYGFATLLFM